MRHYSNLMADISSNNLHFNAEEYRASGHVLIGIKATEGTRYINPNHRSWCLHAGLVHVGVAHYHFARPDLNTDPHAEADHFLSVAQRLSGGRDYLVLDLERATPNGWKHDPAWSRAFDEYVQGHSRFHSILYANKSTLEQSDQWLTGDVRRVWDADWSTDRDYAPPGYSVAFRQFTDGTFGPGPHSLPGVGQCDISRISPAIMANAIHLLP